ncbi:hypothetical protein [Heliomicrobium modesticaldum]|uniref:hypothetical protein n=1 Tax=Heliomicrobium modesticaldum TaxID=35701 RepID=UPI00059CF7AC|nr:hypothetical protein [Heliomicrobium modesticaldum]
MTDRDLLLQILERIDRMEKRMDRMETRQDEMYQILRATEANQATSRAELVAVTDRVIQLERG